MNALSNTINALSNIVSNTVKTMGYTALGFTLKNSIIPSPQTLDNTVNFLKTFSVADVLSQIPETFNTYTEIDPNWAEKLTHHRDAIGLAGVTAVIFSVANETLKVAPVIKNAPKTRVALATAVTVATIGAAQVFFDPSVTAEVAYRYFITASAVTMSLFGTRLACKSISASTDYLAWGITKICSGVIRVTEELQPMSWPTGPAINSTEVNYSVQTEPKGLSSAHSSTPKKKATKKEFPEIAEPTLRGVESSQPAPTPESDLEANSKKDSESEEEPLEALSDHSDALDPLSSDAE